jgi:hypothetical protein
MHTQGRAYVYAMFYQVINAHMSCKHSVGVLSKSEGLQKWLALDHADMLRVICKLNVCILGQTSHPGTKRINQ